MLIWILFLEFEIAILDASLAIIQQTSNLLHVDDPIDLPCGQLAQAVLAALGDHLLVHVALLPIVGNILFLQFFLEGGFPVLEVSNIDVDVIGGYGSLEGVRVAVHIGFIYCDQQRYRSMSSIESYFIDRFAKAFQHPRSHLLPHLLFGQLVVDCYDFFNFVLHHVGYAQRKLEINYLRILLRLRFCISDLVFQVEELLHLGRVFHVEVYIVKKLKKVLILEPAKVILDIIPVEMIQSPGIGHILILDLRELTENLLLIFNFVLFHLPNHLGCRLVLDVRDLPLILDLPDLRVFVPLIALSVAPGLVPEFVEGLKIVAAGKSQQRIHMHLLHCLLLVEVEFLKDRNNVILQLSQSKYLHTDIEDNLVLIVRKLILEQFRLFILFPQLSQLWVQFQAGVQESNSLICKFIFSCLRDHNLACQFFEPVLNKLLFLLISEIVEVGIVDEFLSVAHQFIENAPETPVV